MNLVINTDGAARGNPGPASFAFIIKESAGPILHQEAGFIGQTTNNVAEYTAVQKALEYVQKQFVKSAPHTILLLTDSQLMAQQLAGNYKVKTPHIKVLFDTVKSIELEVGTITYRNIPRAQNYIADKLANQALDKQLL